MANEKSNRKTSRLISIIAGITIPLIVATTNLGDFVFNKGADHKANKASKEMGISRSELYTTPLGNYYVSNSNLSNLLMLAGYDAGTVNQERGGEFDPEVQKEDLLKTCVSTDYNKNHILTSEEINRMLKEKYGYEVKPF